MVISGTDTEFNSVSVPEITARTRPKSTNWIETKHLFIVSALAPPAAV